MNRNISAMLISISCLAAGTACAQGIINDGAYLVISNNGTVYIDGGANGNYTNQGNGQISVAATGGTILLEGNWTNNAANVVFTSNNGTVELNGANQAIGGTNSTSFNNLVLSGTGTKTLNIATTVGGGYASPAGVLSVGARVLDLNGFMLTMTNPAAAGITYTTGYIQSETNAAVNPSIIQWNMGTSTGAHVYPFGAGGAQIPFTFNKTTAGSANISVSTRSTAGSPNTPWAGASNVGAVTHMYDPTLAQDGSDEAVIDRWWDITASAAVTANLIFTYRASENTMIAPYQTGAIGAQHWDGTYWEPPVGTGTAVTAGTGTVSVTGASTFSPWVLASMAAPLPIELLSFTGECDGQKVILEWTTATETNNDYFTVERSYNGTDFEIVSIVDGAGTSNVLHEYMATDNSISGASAYYRLKQTDFDGHYSYSGIIGTSCRESNDWMYAVSDVNGLTIVLSASENASYMLDLYDIAGRKVTGKKVSAEKGVNRIEIPRDLLSEGVYLITMQGGQRLLTAKAFVR